MAWNGNNDTVLHTAPLNYMYGEKVFLLDEITTENCAYLLGDISQFVFDENNAGKKLIFIINSPGGEIYVAFAILGLINTARINNIEILTFVMGEAASAASLIAAAGDIRCMTKYSKHMLHFGTIVDVTQKYSEMEKIYKQNKAYADSVRDLYYEMTNNKLTPKKLEELEIDERGYVTANDCLKYGLCDCILEDELETKLAQDSLRDEFENSFEDFIKNKNKRLKPKKNKNSKSSKVTKTVKKTKAKKINRKK